MNGLALCAGIGGLELGVARALGGRYRCVGYVERDAYAASVLVARMEDEGLDRAPVFDDLESFPGHPYRGRVDLVTAGFPCQPASVAGSRLGRADERWIWPLIAGIIERVSPSLVFLENVPGLLTVDGGAGFREVLESLAALGFDAEWGLLRASDVGAPHRRERLFVLAVADRNGAGLPQLGLGGVLDREREAFGGDVDGCSGDVAEPAREQVGASGLARANTIVADPENRSSRRSRPRRAPPDDSIDMGNANGARLEGRRDSERSRPDERPPWPPGPEDALGWERWRAAGGPEPAVRRDADGLSAAMVDRADRLRCLGNAVVPAQAERAFRLLVERAMNQTTLAPTAIGTRIEGTEL